MHTVSRGPEAAERHRIRERARYRRRWRKTHKYGLKDGAYERMLAEQNGRCALCAIDLCEESGKRNSAHIDHTDGGVRGLLCFVCNQQLSLTERLGSERIAAYLRRRVDANGDVNHG